MSPGALKVKRKAEESQIRRGHTRQQPMVTEKNHNQKNRQLSQIFILLVILPFFHTKILG